MESLQPWLSYLGIGLGGILGALVLVWIVVSLVIFARTKGLPQAISGFLTLIAEGNLTGAYQLTSDRFKTRTSKKDFTKFINKNKLHQYQRTLMSMPTTEDNVYRLEVTVVTKAGKEIPLVMDFVKQERNWIVDDLKYNFNSNYPSSSK